jgi:creatinine amidohydrolase
MADTVLMEEMTWVEIRDAIASGKDIAVFACGATEQHGPHLPTGTDTYLGTAIAERAARMLGNALVAPTLRPGSSAHHMAFPGTLTLRFETFIMVLEDYCTSLAQHGFKQIIFFSSHGGNTDLMAAHFPAIAKKLADKAFVFMVTPLLEAMQRQADFLKEHGISRGAAGAHAGYIETAEMLVVQEHLVRMSQAAPGRSDEAFYAPGQVRLSQLESFTKGIHTQSPNGILGDPTGARVDLGDQLLDMRAEMIVEQVRLLERQRAG